MICNVVGARPNFMKIAPIVRELSRRQIPQLLVHTGQHYDAAMSQIFFDQLGMPTPDLDLGVGSGSHAVQTARILIAFEEVCLARKPDLIVVGGDVNSTMAAALVAAKLCIPLAHVEAGLRSFDRAMPEEVNRVVTDHLSNLLFTTEKSGNENLLREGIAADHIHFVGNCMVDTLLKHLDRALAAEPWREVNLEPKRYALVTLHRPSNVDDAKTLRTIFETLAAVARRLPVLFPAHPRTRARLRAEDIAVPPALRLCDPLPYLPFVGLMARAAVVLTDSGGIQEETTALGVPCLTLRDNTERPVTVAMGTNRLVGTDADLILRAVDEVLADAPVGERPPLWDGRAAQRVVDVLTRGAA